MGKLVFGGVLMAAALLLAVVRAGIAPTQRASGGVLKAVSWGLVMAGLALVMTALVVVIEPGEVGVRHAFGTVDPAPLLPGVNMVTPWSSVERYSTREEQYPSAGEQVEEINALSSEQMGVTVDAGLRWQINPQDAPRIFTEIGTEDQIRSIVYNAIRKGVRDGMSQFSINDIGKRNLIATMMEGEVDSALITQPRAGGPAFRIAEVTAFFLRDLQPPKQVVDAINNKIAQEQQIETERHRVEVARLQSEQQRLLNQTLTAEALTKQYLEVLHDLRNTNNTVILVPTEGGIPLLDIGKLQQNLKR
ncbi:MAG TPA: SPFH domain-containing protein [Gemmatimonadales bacterium]|nr:SPFH domain-containing protein [Gemmatimonadales bacterium]